MPWSEVAVVIASSVLGGLFSATDAALTALPEGRLRAIADVSRSGSAIRRAAENRDATLGRLLMGRVACVVVASVVAARIEIARMGATGAWVAAVVVIVFYTTIAEIAASLVRPNATSLAPTLLAIIRPFELVVFPIAWPLTRVGALTRALDVRRSVPSDPAEDARLAQAEVAHLIEQGQQSGALDQAELLQAAVDFRGVVASQVMVPRTKMIGIEMQTPLTRVLDIIIAEGHSRFPVYAGRIDEIRGLLYVKDLFRVVRDRALDRTTLRQLTRTPVLFVQEAQDVSSILKEMRSRQLHMAIVLDEYGGTAGIVTLEDILELLVGEIRDEHDEVESWHDLGQGRLLVDASLPAEQLAERMGVELPESDHAVSIGGLVMEQLGTLPAVGTVVRVGPIELTVREADQRRIRRVEVVVKPPESASEGGHDHTGVP